MLLSLLNDIPLPYHYLLIVISNTSDDKCDIGHGWLSNLDNAFVKVIGFPLFTLTVSHNLSRSFISEIKGRENDGYQ